MPLLQFPLTPEQFRQLPRHGAFQYDFLNGMACLNPRAKYYHSLLDLETLEEEKSTPADNLKIRRVQPEDWPELGNLFRAAFSQVQPFASLDSATMDLATWQCLERTRTGKDGPLVTWASNVAEDSNQRLIGAIIITLVPGGDPCDRLSYSWDGPPPPDLIDKGFGQPHLTWIFVSPLAVGLGTGSALLAASAHALQQRGYSELWSTFLSGNESSLLWHWRNGFRLLPYPTSRRRRMELFRQRTGQDLS